MTKIFAFILLLLLFTDQIVFSQRGPMRDRGPEIEKFFKRLVSSQDFQIIFYAQQLHQHLAHELTAQEL